jgi:sugar phosphate isomerase/epimerase
MELAYFADEVSKTDFDEAVRLGVEAGATGIELRGGIWEKRVQEIDDDEVKRVQEVLDKYGVKVYSVGSPVGKCHEDDPAEQDEHRRMFDRMVELAQVFDTRVIRGFSLWNPRIKEAGIERRDSNKVRPDLDRYLEKVVSFLAPIVKTASSAGVTLSLENEGATIAGTCAEARRVADALDAETGAPDGFTFCWDVVNGIHCGESHMPEGYALLKGRITHFHVKPNAEKEIFPILGTEDASYGDLIRTLQNDGYKGVASVEHWGSPELMLKGVRQLREVLDSL